MGIFPYGPRWGIWKGLFNGDFERWMRQFSPLRTRWDERDPSTRNFENSLKVGSGSGISLSMGALLGEHGGAPLIGALNFM